MAGAMASLKFASPSCLGKSSRIQVQKGCEGVPGAVAKATGWSAPTQGSNLGRRTFMLRGLSLVFPYQKKFNKGSRS